MPYLFARGAEVGWRILRCDRLFVLPLGLFVDAALRGHGGALASTSVRWVAVRVEFGALDLNGESSSELSRLLVRVENRGLFCRYGRQIGDRSMYRMSILASEGIEPLFRLKACSSLSARRPVKAGASQGPPPMVPRSKQILRGAF